MKSINLRDNIPGVGDPKMHTVHTGVFKIT
jgi:hypothetical protein